MSRNDFRMQFDVRFMHGVAPVTLWDDLSPLREAESAKSVSCARRKKTSYFRGCGFPNGTSPRMKEMPADRPLIIHFDKSFGSNRGLCNGRANIRLLAGP